MNKGNNKERVALIENRWEKGKREYNQEVDVFDGRDWITEALEEILDACVYLSSQLLLIKKRGSDE